MSTAMLVAEAPPLTPSKALEEVNKCKLLSRRLLLTFTLKNCETLIYPFSQLEEELPAPSRWRETNKPKLLGHSTSRTPQQNPQIVSQQQLE